MDPKKSPWRFSERPWPCDRFEKCLLVLLVCAVLFGVWSAWDGYYRDRVFPKRFAVVDEGVLYRSGELSEALVEDTWRDYDIDVVVNLGRDKPHRPNHVAAQRAAEHLGIERSMFNLNGDGTGKPEVFTAALQCITEARRQGKRTLVHCKAGQHRTGAIVAAYRMLYDGWGGDAALKELMSFDVQHPDTIVRYLNANLGEIAYRLVQAGALRAVPDPLPHMPLP